MKNESMNTLEPPTMFEIEEQGYRATEQLYFIAGFALVCVVALLVILGKRSWWLGLSWFVGLIFLIAGLLVHRTHADSAVEIVPFNEMEAAALVFGLLNTHCQPPSRMMNWHRRRKGIPQCMQEFVTRLVAFEVDEAGVFRAIGPQDRILLEFSVAKEGVIIHHYEDSDWTTWVLNDGTVGCMRCGHILRYDIDVCDMCGLTFLSLQNDHMLNLKELGHVEMWRTKRLFEEQGFSVEVKTFNAQAETEEEDSPQ